MLESAILVARLLQYAGSLVLFGSALFFLYGFGGDWGGTSVPRFNWTNRLLLLAAGVALLASLLWLMGETASLTGNLRNSIDRTSLWSIVSETGFGSMAAARIGALACSILLLLALRSSPRLWMIEAAIGALVMASFAWTGHGSMDSGAPGLLHRGSDVAHLLAAGVWIGALFPLSIQVLRSVASGSRADASISERALARFSGVGTAVVSTLILTGVVNSWFLLGPARWHALFTTDYGRLLVVKLALFALMLILAATNRYRFVPALNTSIMDYSSTLPTLKRLRLSVFVETTLAVIVVAVVAVLGALAPPVSTQ